MSKKTVTKRQASAINLNQLGFLMLFLFVQCVPLNVLLVKVKHALNTVKIPVTQNYVFMGFSPYKPINI